MKATDAMKPPLRSEAEARRVDAGGAGRARRRDARLLRELIDRLENSAAVTRNISGDMNAEKLAGRLQDDANAVRRALDYMGRHVNLHTGELTEPIDGPSYADLSAEASAKVEASEDREAGE